MKKNPFKPSNFIGTMVSGHATILTVLFAFFTITCSFSSCSNNDEKQIQTLGISGISIPNPWEITTDQSEITLQGKGLQVGDQILFIADNSSATSYEAPVTSVTDNSFTLQLPKNFYSGNYNMKLKRNTTEINLCQSSVKITLSTYVPDKEGMTVKGIISSNGVGLSGVAVSDGITITTTDENGIYYLPSKKKYGFVFISIPAGYEVDNDGNAPIFYKRIDTGAPDKVEQCNFTLTKVDNDKHAVLALADFHLAKRNDDLNQFATFATDINSTINDLSAAGYKVYGLSLGDESWDAYWYANSYALPESYKEMAKIGAPTFHCMGNHDNDPYYADDWMSEQAWLRVCGPSYYSFNIGKVHYIVLDNIKYLNAGAKNGTIGKRNYDQVIIEEEMEWLKQDLALLKDKAQPVVIAMHAPLYNRPYLLLGMQGNSLNMENANAFIALLKDFKNVQVLTGHTHVNFNVEQLDNLMEHNTAAVCATWWWTGKLSKNHICVDGTPGGYGVYDWDNTTGTWYYKSAGHDKNYQFRAYDLNNTYIDPATYAPKYVSDMTYYARNYATKNSNNEVLINVWNYDSKWKVEVTENGKPLTVTRVTAYDPLHIISYDAQRIKTGGEDAVTFPTESTTHMFKVKASSPTSTLNIKVTDRFGRVYSEEMQRPKEFSLNMK